MSEEGKEFYCLESKYLFWGGMSINQEGKLKFMNEQ